MKRSEILEERFERLSRYEAQAAASGYTRVAGVDEAGRGPLAGPVVAGACILGDMKILGLNDSKKLSASVRDTLFEQIMMHATAWSVSAVEPSVIDSINILEATKNAMFSCIESLNVIPDCVLSDALKIPGIRMKCIPIVHGDALSNSIAAASILAKVHRDRLMCEYDDIYPGYGFSKHKGYGTKEHYEALRRLGPSPIHRQSFLRSFFEGNGKEAFVEN
ncbi:MAG: ribonuclease HII [Clostridiaceae bacterium]|jgi:ribonuclease HII|nr:ribonuclease HII [Oscillospiraceae bacterium]NLO63006.1 ribonuclease HII [Clostridiaceae bacterium]